MTAPDYTPTTGEVRDVYAGTNEVDREAFDRWLNKLLAETWHEGACDYYRENPYGQVDS